MAFTRKRTVGKRSFRKTYVPKSVKRYVAKKIDATQEDMCIQLSLPTYFSSVGTTWVEQILSDPAVGTGKSQRIGQKIRVKSLEIKGVISQASNQSGADDPWSVMRIVIGQYACGGGVGYTPLASAALTLNDAIKRDFNSARSLLKKKFFDKYVALNVSSTEKGAGDGYTPQVKTFNYYKKFARPITCTWTDATVNNPSDGLIMSCISDSAVIVNPGFVAGYILIRYEDA